MNENKSSALDTTFASMSSTSSATMIGFSVTIITLIITLVEDLGENPNINFVLLFYVLAIIFFIFATEFFVLSVSDKENYDKWCLFGSMSYGLGLGWIIVGVSLTFDVLVNLKFLAYFTLTLFLLGLIIYYIIRQGRLREESDWKKRIVARSIILAQILIGYIAIHIL